MVTPARTLSTLKRFERNLSLLKLQGETSLPYKAYFASGSEVVHLSNNTRSCRTQTLKNINLLENDLVFCQPCLFQAVNLPSDVRTLSVMIETRLLVGRILAESEQTETFTHVEKLRSCARGYADASVTLHAATVKLWKKQLVSAIRSKEAAWRSKLLKSNALMLRKLYIQEYLVDDNSEEGATLLSYDESVANEKKRVLTDKREALICLKAGNRLSLGDSYFQRCLAFAYDIKQGKVVKMPAVFLRAFKGNTLVSSTMLDGALTAAQMEILETIYDPASKGMDGQLDVAVESAKALSS